MAAVLEEGSILHYAAWGRDGSAHTADEPEKAARAAYGCKAPGTKRRPVLVMAVKVGGPDLRGQQCRYSVPLGWWEPAQVS